jgi:hypothetical protein
MEVRRTQGTIWKHPREAALLHKYNNIRIYRSTQLIMFLNYCLLCSIHVSANPHGHLQASAWGGVLHYSTTILQPYYVPFEISYYVHHGRIVVKYKFYNPVRRWGYIRFCSCSPGAASCVFCMALVCFLIYSSPVCSFTSTVLTRSRVARNIVVV